MKEIKIEVYEGINEVRLMKDLVCIIEGNIFIDQFPHLMEHVGALRSYRLDSHNDWFAVLTRKGESMHFGEPPVEHDTLVLRHRYHMELLMAVKPWLEYRFSPKNLFKVKKTKKSFGSWTDREGDSVDIVNAIRKGDERNPRINEVLRRAEEVFKDLEKAMLWMSSPSYALGGQVPLQVIQSEEGIDVIFDELGRIEHGIPI